MVQDFDQLFAEEAIEVAPSAVEVLRPGKLTRQEQVEAEFKAMEERLFSKSAEVLDDSLDFVALDPKTEQLDPKAIEGMSPERAERKRRTAIYAAQSAKDAPVGLKIAANVATSIARTRSMNGAGPKVLNIAVIQMPAMPFRYPEREVGDT